MFQKEPLRWDFTHKTAKYGVFTVTESYHTERAVIGENSVKAKDKLSRDSKLIITVHIK